MEGTEKLAATLRHECVNQVQPAKSMKASLINLNGMPCYIAMRANTVCEYLCANYTLNACRHNPRIQAPATDIVSCRLSC